MRAAATALLLALLLLPSFVPAAALSLQQAEPGLAGPALLFVLPAVGRGAWDNATQAAQQTRFHAQPVAAWNASLARGLNATLDALDAALAARDVVAARVAVVQARVALANVGYARAFEPFLYFATGPERWDNASATAAFHEHTWQRFDARVAEEARLGLRLWVLALQKDLPDEARVWHAVVRGWTGALASESLRLPEATKAEWDRLVGQLEAPTANATAAAQLEKELRPLLLGLGLGRTLVRLDDLGDEVLTAALAAHAAVLAQRETPGVGAALLRDGALQDLPARYAAARGGIFLGGEGRVEPLDANVSSLSQLLSTGGSSEALQRTLQALRADLARIAHLTFGAFVKAQFVHVRPERPIQQDVQAGRFPFEGVASWNLTLRFDPAVAKVGRVDPVHFQLDAFDWDNTEGLVTLRGTAASPVLRDGVLARLHWVAFGAPLQETNVTFDDVELRDAQGGRVELFLVAPGRVIVAQVDPVKEAASEEDPMALSNPDLKRKSPGVEAFALVLAVLGLALLRSKRHGPS